MREPSLQKTTALSAALHISILLISLLLLRQSSQFLIPSSYTVNLVTPEVLKGIERGKSQISSETTRDTSVTQDAPKEDVNKKLKEELVEEKISAIEAKKRVERIVRLRSTISLKKGVIERNISDTSSINTVNTVKGTISDDYYTKIRNQIWQQWVYPDIGQKDLEAIISIRIMKDGTISMQKIEKSSGNPLFDKSAIKAITKANPLSPPPYEMEVGVKFYP
jgi:colicin import membrane protein